MIELLELVKFDTIIRIVDFMFKKIFYPNLHYYYYRKILQGFSYIICENSISFQLMLFWIESLSLY